MKKEQENMFSWNDIIQKTCDENVFNLYEDEINESYNHRNSRKNIFKDLVTGKIDKLTDEQLEKFIEFFEGLE